LESAVLTTDNFCFYLQNKLIQTSQTGGQWYSDTALFCIPYMYYETFYIQNCCRIVISYSFSHCHSLLP
jgi:hypothetical protein